MTRQPRHSAAVVVASAVPAVVVVWSVDPWTPLFVGVPLILTLAWFAPREMTAPPRIAWISLVVGVVSTTTASLFYANPRGEVYVTWGFATVSDGSIAVAIAVAMRILAIALPAILFASTVSAHEFVATCAVRRVMPRRMALATLIALRLVPVIAGDLDETRHARRANGLRSSVIATALTTLVVAMRRAIRMSDVAESRGFSRANRLWSAYRPFTPSDWALVAVAIAIGFSALATTAVIGEWNSAIR